MITNLPIDKLVTFVSVFCIVCIVVIAAIILDLWDGVYTAKVTGQRVHSHKLRVTINKTSEYWRFILIGFLVDCLGTFFSFYFLPFVTITFGVALLIVEAKSMFEHSARRKSHTTDIPDIIRQIIGCITERDALNIVEQLNTMQQTAKDEDK